MFEREIKFIYDFNLNKVNKLGPYFTFEQLSFSGIHPAILHYISSEIDFLIFEDRQKLLKNSVFDYSGEKINHLFSQITDEVKRSKRFSSEYISKLILHASSFTINFLVRPKWTLEKFVFDEGEHKTTVEIKQILNYLYYYKHIKTILISYINTKKIISMNSEEFSALLNKVDNLGIESYLSSILTGSLKSMAEFFNIGEIQKNKIPLIAVQTFLEEKELYKQLDKLNSVFGEDTSAKYTLAEYQKIFDSILIEREEQLKEETQDLFESVVEEHDIQATDENEAGEKDAEDRKEDEEIEQEEIVENVQQDTAEDEQVDLKDEEINETESVERKPVKIKIKMKDDIEIEKIEEEIKKEETVEPEEEKIEEEDHSFFGKYEEEIIEDVDEIAKNTIEEEINGEIEEVVVEDDQEQDQEEEPESESLVKEERETEIEEDEFDKVAREIESVLEYKDNYDEFEKDEEEVKDSDEDAESILDNIGAALEDDDEEKESMLRTILSNKDDDEGDEKIINKREDKKKSKKEDLTELLEHKEMTKIIEVVFDYDIEELSNTLEEILECRNVDDAIKRINKVLKQHNVSRKSKEAELFKKIISDYFGHN
jgi:hypothetical protein